MFHVEHRAKFPEEGEKGLGVGKIVAVANQKGGVGKTTTSVNLSAALALAGRSVLLVDVDPQANATSGLGLDPRTLSHTIYDCLMRDVKALEAVRSTSVPRLFVIPSGADLAGAEVELVTIPNRETVLKAALESVQDRFELIVLDCPPALGLLTINALVAASSVLVPVQCEYYAMEGLGRLMANLQRVRDSLNPGLVVEGILLTMFDPRNSLSRQVAEEIKGHFKDKVYQSVIPRNVTLAEAPSYGKPVLLYNAASGGSQAYLELAKEFMKHGKESPR
ncbi:MAG: ParA family protein [Nitrospiraceae bacterium]